MIDPASPEEKESPPSPGASVDDSPRQGAIKVPPDGFEEVPCYYPGCESHDSASPCPGCNNQRVLYRRKQVECPDCINGANVINPNWPQGTDPYLGRDDCERCDGTGLIFTQYVTPRDTEVQRLREAVTGDIDPQLWFVSWTESVLSLMDHMLTDHANGDTDDMIARIAEDPQSLHEANRNALEMCKRLREALAVSDGGTV